LALGSRQFLQVSNRRERNGVMRDRIEQCHRAYCQATGQEIRLNAFDRERVWYEFLALGFTVEDVGLVGRFLVRAVEKGDRNPGCLRFRNLIGRPDDFEEELQLVRAAMRNFKPAPTEKEKTIRAFRPTASAPEPVSMDARPAKEVVGKLIDELRRAAQ